jgi:hypothetical protein
MRHVASPVLRRLVDEPLAVPDRDRRHLAECEHCQAHSTEIAADAALASRMISASAQIAAVDVDLEWILLQDRLQPGAPGASRAPRRGELRRPRRMPRRMVNVSVGAGTAAVVGVVAVGVAAAAALTTVYAPTHVAPVQVSSSDLRAVDSITGIGTAQLADGLPTSGSRQLAFGDLSWSTAGQPQQVSSIAAARAMTHLALPAPATLPAGVGAPSRVMVQPEITITVQFSQSAGSGVGGSTLEITAGPAIAVQYGGRSGGSDLTTLAIVAARRPLATSTGATASQLETFLLSQAGLPSGLVEQLRLLGNPTATLPVPIPRGMWVQRTHIGGAQALLVTDSNAFASGVIWESHDGVVYGVGGLLDREDVLSVARQVG